MLRRRNSLCARSRRRRNAPSRRPHSRSARVISLWISSYSAMASFDSLVKGTHTDAMWTKITIGPEGALADGREAVGRRRHDLGGLNRLVELLGGLAVQVARSRVGREAGGRADLRGEGRRHAAEIAREKSGDRVAPRVLRHLEQH